MDFKDYINELNELDNKEAKAELETFYTINSATFKFYKAIDSTIQELLMQQNVNIVAKKQLEDALPLLIKLRAEILEIDSATVTIGYKKKIDKAVNYIKDSMAVNEVNEKTQNFLSLLEENKIALAKEEQNKIEASKSERAKYIKETQEKIITVEEAEKFFGEIENAEGDALGYLDLKILKLLAEKSNNNYILESIVNYILEPDELQSCDEEELWETGEYLPYVLLNSINNNSKLNAYLRKKINNESPYIKREVAKSSFTNPNTLAKLADDEDEFVSSAARENPNYIGPKSGCFIATACYGDYDAPEVLILRKYRDEHLLTTWYGRLFVKFYYAVSPSLAKRIEKSDKVKQYIRNHFLSPIVMRIQYRSSNIAK